MGTIYCGGREIEVDASVTTWRTRPQLGFPRLKMRRETRGVVWHWTAGEGSALAVHRTLTERVLSVHFVIEADGTIVQFADCETRCSHAKGANSWAIGVEMVNRANGNEHQNGVERTLVRETIHGKELTVTAFLPEQMLSALALADALERAYELPGVVPMDGHDVATTVLPVETLATWRGHIGHYHLTATKRDPGLALMRALAARPLREAGEAVA